MKWNQGFSRTSCEYRRERAKTDKNFKLQQLKGFHCEPSEIAGDARQQKKSPWVATNEAVVAHAYIRKDSKGPLVFCSACLWESLTWQTKWPKEKPTVWAVTGGSVERRP